jgi:hypothetical protein
VYSLEEERLIARSYYEGTPDGLPERGLRRPDRPAIKLLREHDDVRQVAAVIGVMLVDGPGERRTKRSA